MEAGSLVPEARAGVVVLSIIARTQATVIKLLVFVP
jgi:hypothetical protein